MQTSEFSNQISKLIRQRNSAYVTVILLMISLIFTSAAAFFKKERIVIMPTIGESYALGADDGPLLEKMGVFLSNLFLNRSPVDAQWRNRMILKHTAPSFYHDLKQKLDQEYEFLTHNKEQAFVFYPEKADGNLANLSFVIEGRRVVFVGTDGEKTHISQGDRKRYIFKFKRNGDQFLLASIHKENLP